MDLNNINFIIEIKLLILLRLTTTTNHIIMKKKEQSNKKQFCRVCDVLLKKLFVVFVVLMSFLLDFFVLRSSFLSYC